MKVARGLSLGLALSAAPALAGPPYDTDDPVPTETGHWEIYAFTAATRGGRLTEGTAGIDLNYGPVERVQLTATLPFAFTSADGGHVAGGDVEAGIKYQFARGRTASAAIFPRVILPTAGARFGTGRAAFLLPLWVQKDIGRVSVFGGGGYTINPGAGQRDYWSEGLAATVSIDPGLSAGIEVTHFGADAIGTRSETRFGAGGSIHVAGPYALLFSGGPTFVAGQHHAQAHGYVALQLSF